jgi:hypothetical protein
MGLDSTQVLQFLAGDRLPAAVGIAISGAFAGYTLMVIATVLFRRDTCLPHDAWSGTRVIRRQVTGSSLPPAPTAAWHRLTLGVILSCSVLALPIGAWSGDGFKLALLRRTPAEIDPVARSLEHWIGSSVGVRSDVSLVRRQTWSGAHPTRRALQVTVGVPWAAFDEERATLIRQIVADSIRVNPAAFPHLDIIVSSSLSGLLQTSRSLKWSWDYDSIAARWVAVDSADR